MLPRRLGKHVSTATQVGCHASPSFGEACSNHESGWVPCFPVVWGSMFQPRTSPSRRMLPLAEGREGRQNHLMDLGPAGYRKRCKRWDIPHDVHCLTFSCFHRQPFLRSDRSCRWFAQALLDAKDKHPFDLWAYVLMPEHVHLVLWPQEGTLISPLLKAIKLPVTNRCLQWVRRYCPDFLPWMEDRRLGGPCAHRFWQRGGGYDRNLRSVRDVHEKIRYIHANPVRRGLVRRPEEWFWSSAATYETARPGPIPLDLNSLPPPPLS